MRKIILAAGAIMALGVASCNPSKESLKKDFVKTCNDEGDKQVTDPKMRTMFHEYCDCAGEKAVNKFTIDDWKEINKLQKNKEEQKLLDKLTPVIQPCLNELQNKMMQSMNSNNNNTISNAQAPTEPAPSK